MSCPIPGFAAMALLCSLGACAPEPKEDGPAEGTRRAPITPTPCPATDAALAKGPPLRLDDTVFDDQGDVLDRLQVAITRVGELEAENGELTARLTAAGQANQALTTERDECRRQVAQLSDDLKARADALARREAELSAAKTALADLQPKAEQATDVATQIAGLKKKLADATAANDQLRDRALQADLARVKAQQDLVLLQITVARQKALLKPRARPTEAKAPLPPTGPSQEPTR